MNIIASAAIVLLFSFVPARADIIWWHFTNATCLYWFPYFYITFMILSLCVEACALRFFIPDLSYFKVFVFTCVANIGSMIGSLTLVSFLKEIGLNSLLLSVNHIWFTTFIFFIMSVGFKIMILSYPLGFKRVFSPVVTGTIMTYMLLGSYMLIKIYYCEQ